jgi:predicted xylose isomerase-like sugar epimerase
VTAAQEGLDMGQQSARFLINRIAHPDLPAQQVFLKARILNGSASHVGMETESRELGEEVKPQIEHWAEVTGSG